MMSEKQKDITPKSARRTKPFSSRWLKALIGVALIGVGIAAGFMWWSSEQNIFFGLITIISLTAGCILAIRNVWQILFHDQDNVIVGIESPDINKTKTPVNCLNIYAGKNENGKNVPWKIVFEYIENPKGQPQQCINDGKWYYVNITDKITGELRPFTLPDARYCPPSLLARYILIPAQRKYLRHRDGWQKFIGPGILGVMNAVGFVAIIALAG